MDEYLSEKEQVEEIKKWWSENGRYVVAGLILGIAGLLGWNQWQAYKLNRSTAGSDTYAALQSAITLSESTAAIEIGEQLMTEYQDTPYAAQAALALARFHLAQAEPARAEDLLGYVVANAGDDELRQVARLRLARVQIDQESYDAALQTLALDKAGSFAAQFHELRGDARHGMGETEAAREEYTSALGAAQAGTINNELVRMKLDSLPATAATAGDVPETS